MKRLLILLLVAALFLGAMGPGMPDVQTDSGASAMFTPHGSTAPPSPPPEGGGDYGFDTLNLDILA